MSPTWNDGLTFTQCPSIPVFQYLVSCWPDQPFVLGDELELMAEGPSTGCERSERSSGSKDFYNNLVISQ
jgi:hypothetical protein